MGRSGLAVGLNKGYITTAIAKKKIRNRPSLRKGKLGNRVKSIRYPLRQVISEVVGFAPYEKRIIELIKSGQAKDLKKAGKIAAHRLGTNRRGKIKRIQLENVVRAQRKRKQE